MAKKDKANKKAKPDPKAEKEAEREFKYGVEDLAEELGIKPASVRVQLRNHGIEKAGKSYGWNSKSDLQEVIDTISSEKEKSSGKKAKKDEKPAKANKKAKGKKAKDEEDED